MTTPSHFITPDEAVVLGYIKPNAAPQKSVCPYCGRELTKLGLLFQNQITWVSHEPCGCEGELEAERRDALFQEQERRANRERRLARSGIQRRYWDAVASMEPKCTRFLSGYRKHGGGGLYIYGDVGTGKTYLASAVAIDLVDRGAKVIFTSALSIFASIQDTYTTNESTLTEKRRYMTCDLLVLDDLGKESASQWSVMTLFEIVNDRYEHMLPIVITSQYSLGELTDRLARAGERETAKAIASRIREGCAMVHLTGMDRRSRTRMPLS